jgi:hypothetical protein
MGKRKEDDLRTARIAVMFTDEERDRLRDLAGANGKTVATEVYDRVRFSLQLPHDFDFNATRAKEKVVADLRIALEELGVIPRPYAGTLLSGEPPFGAPRRGRGGGLLGGPVLNALAAGFGNREIPVTYDVTVLAKSRDKSLKGLLDLSDVVVTDDQYRKIKGGDDEALAVLDEMRKNLEGNIPAVSEITRLPWSLQQRACNRLFSALGNYVALVEICYVRRFANATNNAIELASRPLLRIDKDEVYQKDLQQAVEELAGPLGEHHKELKESDAELLIWRNGMNERLFALQEKLSADPLASLED